MKICQRTKNNIAKAFIKELFENQNSLVTFAYYGNKGIYNLSEDELIELSKKYKIEIEYE